MEKGRWYRRSFSVISASHNGLAGTLWEFSQKFEEKINHWISIISLYLGIYNLLDNRI